MIEQELPLEQYPEHTYCFARKTKRIKLGITFMKIGDAWICVQDDCPAEKIEDYPIRRFYEIVQGQ